MVFLQSHRTTEQSKIFLVPAHPYTITRIIAINNFNHLKILVGIIKQKEILFGIKVGGKKREGGGGEVRRLTGDRRNVSGVYIIDE